MDTKVLIEKLTKALSFKYPNDRSMPGVTIAFLRNGNFYASLVRYQPDKKVIHKGEDKDLNRLLTRLGKELVGNKERNPMDELNDALSPLPAWPCPDPHAYDEEDDVIFPDYSTTDNPFRF